MNVVIRTDASTHIGSGHVYRCLTLATALRERGASVMFACREHDGHLCDLVEEQFIVRRLPASTDDTSALREIASTQRVDWLVVDHYSLDVSWERELRPYVDKILAIDDLADREHECDVLLDQNLVPDAQIRYRGRLPRSCQLLLGPKYALLQSAYRRLRALVRPREDSIRHICIYFGASDSSNVTARALSAFLQLDRPDIDVDVILGASSPHHESVRALAENRPNVHVHSRLPTLAEVYARADLAIGGAGTTNWERLCLGLPALVVIMAKNQQLVAESLSQRGLVRLLGHEQDTKVSDFYSALTELVREGLRPDWSRRCMTVVDGSGVDRVCGALAAIPLTGLQARRADLGDEHRLLEWTNDPGTRRNSFSQVVVSSAMHQEWLRERLNDAKNCHLYIVETAEGEPLGQVRFERVEQAWSIHFAVAPSFRGRGLARPMLRTALDKFRSSVGRMSILGKVKSDNPRSRRLFEGLGFKLELRAEADVVTYRRLV